MNIPQPSGTQNHVSHIMWGVDRICPACKKCWFAAVDPKDIPLCKIEDWDPSMNWWPAEKATKHGPGLRCFKGEECPMCIEMGYELTPRAIPLSAYDGEAYYE